MQVTDDLKEKVQDMSGQEGMATKKLEQITSALPSTVWLSAAGASIAGALVLKIFGRTASANFVGQWAPTFLLLGIYNKIVKVAGSERATGALS